MTDHRRRWQAGALQPIDGGCLRPRRDVVELLRKRGDAIREYGRILQAALVYVNTLMIQDLLAEPEWAQVLTDVDRRGLTPLFWTHVLPYGEIKLTMTRRLSLTTG